MSDLSKAEWQAVVGLAAPRFRDQKPRKLRTESGKTIDTAQLAEGLLKHGELVVSVRPEVRRLFCKYCGKRRNIDPRSKNDKGLCRKCWTTSRSRNLRCTAFLTDGTTCDRILKTAGRLMCPAHMAQRAQGKPLRPVRASKNLFCLAEISGKSCGRPAARGRYCAGHANQKYLGQPFTVIDTSLTAAKIWTTRRARYGEKVDDKQHVAEKNRDRQRHYRAKKKEVRG